MSPRPPREPDRGALGLFDTIAPPAPPAESPAAAQAQRVEPPQAPAPRVTSDVTPRILEGLNPEQLAAVTHGEGPLLIVAGAGTGKTQVITRRIAWLIAEKKARPEEVLALTFTEKAAAEMEARVDELVPYGFTGTTICTFHAFGDRMLREHAVELGLTSQLRVESDAEFLVFLREHLFELGLARYLPLGKPDEHLRALVSLFDRARDEDVTPERYAAFAAELAAAATTDEDKDRAAAEVEKAGAYAAHERLMVRHGRIDFGAQIGLALKLLRERPYLRREYAERYRYILVDEFQDTNHVQFEIVRLLAGERRNLTVVGDDDQSIYGFRGAQVENMTRFLDVFPGTRELLLIRNYRSGQEILDRAYRLIQFNNPMRLEPRRGYDKRLIAERAIAGEVALRAYRTMSDEADAIAADIAEQIERGDILPGEIAVLARAHQHLEPVALALKAHGVPFQRTSARGLYQRPEIQLVLNVLRSIADPDDGGALYHALGDPAFGVDAVDLAWLSARARHRRASLVALAAEAASDPESGITEPSRAGILRFVELHRRLATSAVHRPTTDVMYEFAEASGLLGRLAAADTPEAVEQAHNLNKLFLIASRIGPLLARDRVDAFIGHLDLLIDVGDDPSAVEVDIDDDTVHLLTAHNAKGLEFRVVYLTQLVEGKFPIPRRHDALELPRELRRTPLDEKAEHTREERRLFYVAMTRARDRLILTHAVDYGGKQARKLSEFVIGALNLPAPPRPAVAPSGIEGMARFAPGVEPGLPEPEPLPDDHPLKLSHYQIDDYLTCPLKYRYAHVLQIPLRRDPRLMFGSAIHHAIRVYHRERMRGRPIDVAGVLKAFAEAWSSEGFYTREHEELRQREGREMLTRFVEREEASGRVPLAIEMDFQFVQGANTVVGRFDRIDERPEGIVLVDYKTSHISEIEAGERADQRAQKSLAESQLGLYALGYTETRERMPARVELDFVESGLVGSATVRGEHLESARDRVDLAGLGIRRADFTPRPDRRKCLDCPYSRFCLHSLARGTA